ncbi:MAG: hypothetical protein JXR10_06680 [Cyclobacteriaceae bacterium]
MKTLWLLVVIGVLLLSCADDSKENVPSANSLAALILSNPSLEIDELIACAAGNNNNDFGTVDFPTSVFFYPVKGSSDFRYYEATDLADSLNFDKYYQFFPDQSPVFNGYLRRFHREVFSGERMCIVTYVTEQKLHISDPIRIKTNTKSTEVNAELGTIVSGTEPYFEWKDGFIDENVIYFQVVSSLDGDFISGTYTYEKHFTFYDVSNVVLNVTDPSTNPKLQPDSTYRFTMMGVSEDNWVNLLIEKEFTTN